MPSLHAKGRWRTPSVLPVRLRGPCGHVACHFRTVKLPTATFTRSRRRCEVAHCNFYTAFDLGWKDREVAHCNLYTAPRLRRYAGALRMGRIGAQCAGETVKLPTATFTRCWVREAGTPQARIVLLGGAASRGRASSGIRRRWSPADLRLIYRRAARSEVMLTAAREAAEPFVSPPRPTRPVWT